MRAPFQDGERDCSAAHLAMQLRKQGYITQLRNAKPRECGKACGRTCLEKLQHTYILVTGSLDSAVTVSPEHGSTMHAKSELLLLKFSRYGTLVERSARRSSKLCFCLCAAP